MAKFGPLGISVYRHDTLIPRYKERQSFGSLRDFRPRMSTISSVKYCWSLSSIRPQAAVERARLSRLFCRQYNQVKEAMM